MIKMSRTTIQIETHEIKTIRFGKGSSTAHCDRCADRVSAITPEQTAEALGISVADVYGLIETSRVHLVNGGQVCARSLDQEGNKQETI